MNTFINKIIPTALFILTPLLTHSQMVYIGLKDEANVRVTQNILLDNNVDGAYWPKTQIIDGYLYIPTVNGLYRKDLSTLHSIDWELFAFEGVPVRDFIKNSDTVMAATAVWDDSNLLLLSTDNGLTYRDYTPESFPNPLWDNKATVLRIAQNPHNRHSLAVLYRGVPGVALSTDFGVTWTLQNTLIGGYQDWFIDFNPNDTTNLFHSGEQIYFDSYIKATYDNGDTWTSVEAIQNHCTHGIAFHPSDKNRMVSYGEYRIAKSTDQGKTWSPGVGVPEYIYKVIYDPANPEILYASGAENGPDEGVRIHRSTDGGDSWHIFYEETMANSDGVMDIHLYDNKLIIYTLVNGVYYLELGASNNFQIAREKLSAVYPSPTSDVINVSFSGADEAVITLLNMNGSVVFQQTTRQPVTSIPVQSFVKGAYFVTIKAGSFIKTHKVIII